MYLPQDIANSDVNEQISRLRRFSDNPSGYLAVNTGNEQFYTGGIDGFVSFREVGRSWIQFGGPFAAPEDRAELLSAFLGHARRAGRRVLALQLQRADAALYAEAGLTVNQIGASYAVSLDEFTLRGKRFVRLRNKISRASRSGLEIAEVPAAQVRDQVESIDALWLADKGRHVKELRFLIGEIGGSGQHERKLFLGTIDGQPAGYISYSPVFGSRPGWLHDLSRRLPTAPPGVMEAINFHACQQFKAGGDQWLHFGFTPFTGLDDTCEAATRSRIVKWVVDFLAEHGDFVYPSASQLEYKLKWEPQTVLPEYMAYEKPFRPSLLWALLKVTNSI